MEFLWDGCDPVYSSSNEVLFDKNQTSLIQFPAGIGGSYSVPGSVASVGYQAFEGSPLTSVMIGNNVTSVGGYAFAFCTSLINFMVPNSVANIADWTFYFCSGLTNITIGTGVTNIGEDAFQYAGLTSITIPN